MTDFSDPSGASLRLSNAERERAVEALQSHAGEGRLTDAELQSRVQSARAAVTRGDLAPLFADLPGSGDIGAAVPAAPHTAPTAAQERPWTATDSERSARPNGRYGYIIVSIVPFIALILFFLSSWAWGFAYSWLWFLLIPIVGIVVYGGGIGDGRDRDRNRR